MINFNRRSRALVHKIESDPYYRFQNIAEIKIGASLGIQIDVNQATVDDWLRLPGISITQARYLVEMINSGLQFLCIEDLAAALGVPVSRIIFWQPILSFAYYDQDSFQAPPKINPNTATLEQLSNIPNLDQVLATEMIKQREAMGNYRNLVDLQRRLNLRPDFVYHLMYYLRFD